jgi:DNA-directed RNA polymerase sigma subunit (sigma70/sigma32)
MILLFGLDGNEPRTLQEVSDSVGMSREMIRQIKNKTLIKMSKNKSIKMAYSEL